MICPECKTTVSENVKVCPTCGFRLVERNEHELLERMVELEKTKDKRYTKIGCKIILIFLLVMLGIWVVKFCIGFVAGFAISIGLQMHSLF